MQGSRKCAKLFTHVQLCISAPIVAGSINVLTPSSIVARLQSVALTSKAHNVNNGKKKKKKRIGLVAHVLHKS